MKRYVTVEACKQNDWRLSPLQATALLAHRQYLVSGDQKIEGPVGIRRISSRNSGEDDSSEAETSVNKISTRRHITEDGILHSHRRENLQSYIYPVISLSSKFL
jgi:hypothetical protein